MPTKNPTIPQKMLQPSESTMTTSPRQIASRAPEIARLTCHVMLLCLLFSEQFCTYAQKALWHGPQSTARAIEWTNILSVFVMYLTVGNGLTEGSSTNTHSHLGKQ